MIRFDNPRKTVFCFDLDDTLYKEIDFLHSGFRIISGFFKGIEQELLQKMLEWRKNEQDVFANLVQMYPDSGLKKEKILSIYREHMPHIALEPDAKAFLTALRNKGCKTALITDGCSITQRNKLKALGLTGFFNVEIISEEFGSEKPAKRNYQAVEEFLRSEKYVYFGENLAKDFIAPKQLGWLTIGLQDDGRNIHQISPDSYPKENLPDFMIQKFSEIWLS